MARIRDRRRSRGALLVLLLFFLGMVVSPPGADLVPGARADEPSEEEVPEDVPVEIEGTITSPPADAEDLGRWIFGLAFTPTEDIDRAYRVELRIVHGTREVLALDHSPKPPTPSWRAGRTVRYEVPVPVPFEAGLRAGDRLDFRVAFFDPDADRSVPPRTEAYLRGGRLTVADVVVPALGATDDEATIVRILERAKALTTEGRKADAWKALERGLRRAEEDATKERFRDGILALGHFDALPLSFVEEQIVRQRIEAERRRHLRRLAGRYWDRGKLYAALRILEAVGGSLQEASDEAVIGALAQARRAQRDMQQIRVRLLDRIISEEDETAARALLEKHGYTEALLKKAEALLEKKRYGQARYLFRDLSLGRDNALAAAARERMDALDEAFLAATPPEEMALVEEAVSHPAFDRIATVVTHNFVYIGPKKLVEGIGRRSRLRFDLAYVFLTDLFGRLPNPGGDRITVFFKELWDFGGGQAAGKRIDIGRADPELRGYRVDTGLLYHELTHCVDDTMPIFAGWREGLANMGAAYCFEALGQKGDELHAFEANLEAFRRHYLERDIAYWRIPGYGPSAGFFLHFEEAHARTPDGHDWKPYRRFFRAYRAAPVRDGREPYVARVFAYYLVQAFGEAAFDDLLRFRLPLEESDRKALGLEVDAFAKGEYRVAAMADEFAAFPNSPLPRDLLAREMLGAAQARRTEEARRISREELGILHDWWVIGPFRSEGADPRLHPFPPEYEIDFTKEYADDYNVCKWRRAGEGPVVQVKPTGWVDFRFSYQDNTATYALSHVTVPETVAAHAHVRADDDVVLFVNDRLVEYYINRGGNGSTWFWWRGPAQQVPDAVRLPVTLKAGRNKVLVKVKNRHGGAGFALAFSRPDGVPIAGLTTDLDPPAHTVVADPSSSQRGWKSVVRHVFRTKSFRSKLDVAVGSFKVVNRRLVGQDTGGGVRWRLYTVRPGFKKDAPSNLAWLREKHTEGIDDFRLTLDLVPRNEGVPKLVVSFQAEGGDDGLSGWNLIVHPRGKGKVGASLERYDGVVVQTRPHEAPGGEVQPLVLTHVDGRLRVTLGALVLLDRVPIQRIAGRHRIGFATWGPELGLTGFRLEAPK